MSGPSAWTPVDEAPSKWTPVGETAIREARPEDAARIVEMGRTFLLNGPYKDDIEDNPQVSRRVADLIISSPMAHVLVAEEGSKIIGIFAMAIAPHFYSGEVTACELIWFVEPEHRAGGIGLKLLKEAEIYARSIQATRMQLTAPTEAVGALYKRCGYHQIEVGYQRRL